MDLIPHTLAGIPCLLRVTSYVKVAPWRGSAQSCPSSDDYYGYTECEWEVLDRKGYRAKWLDKKLSRYEKGRAEETIHNFYVSENEEP